jgi:hypothetical protein
LLVFAASSLQDVFEGMRDDLKANKVGEVKYNFAGSQVLATQIEQGAVADILAVPDEQIIKDLAAKGFITEGIEKVMATNKMVVIVPPGANPKVLADTVATPIEQEVNGVEDMLYMSSTSTMDGSLTLTVTFCPPETVGLPKLTVASQLLSAFTLILDGQLMLGAFAEVTVTVNVHESPESASAETTVDPMGKKQSLQWSTVILPQALSPVGVLK